MKWVDSYFDFGARRGRSAFFVSVDVFRKQATDELTAKTDNLREPGIYTSGTRLIIINIYIYLLFAALHQSDEVSEKHIPVSLTETAYIVWHLVWDKIQMSGNLEKNIMDFGTKTGHLMYRIPGGYIITDKYFGNNIENNFPYSFVCFIFTKL